MDGDPGRIVDALPGLVWTARPDGSVEFLNARWLEESICTNGKPGEMEARLQNQDLE